MLSSISMARALNLEEIVNRVAPLCVIGIRSALVDGKKLILEAADASTWVRDGDEWTCALHAESVLGFARECLELRISRSTNVSPMKHSDKSGTSPIETSLSRRNLANRHRPTGRS